MLARTAVGVSARAAKYTVCTLPHTLPHMTPQTLPHMTPHVTPMRAGMLPQQPIRSFSMQFKPRGYVGSIAQYRGRIDHMRDYYDSLTVVIYLTDGNRVVYTFNNVREHFIFVDTVVEELDIEIKRDINEQQSEESALMHIYAPFMDVNDGDNDNDNDSVNVNDNDNDTYNDREDSASRYFTENNSIYSDDDGSE